MALYADSQGKLWDYADDKLARRAGLRPATREDKERHNKEIDLAAADEDNLQTVGEEITRIGAGAVELASRGVAATGLFQDATQKLDGAPNIMPARETAPDAFSPEAMLRREANPVMAGLGQGLATAPIALATGGVGGAVAGRLGAGALGRTLTAIGTEAATEGVLTEYSDAWLEERDAEFGNVVTNTALAVVGDVFLRGAISKLSGKGVLGGFTDDALDVATGAQPKPTPGTGGLFDTAQDSGVIGRAAAKARKAQPRSAGAAAASKQALDADTDALDEIMPQIRDGKYDKSVALVDTYKDDFVRLAADAVTDNLNVVSEEGLEALRKAKYQNWRAGAEKWTKKNRAAQEEGIQAIIVDRGNQIIGQIKKAATEVDGIKGRDFKGFEQDLPEGIIRFQRAIKEAEGSERNEIADQMKKWLDNNVNRINASRSLSEPDKEYLTNLLFQNEKVGYNNELRTFLEDEGSWGVNAVIQKEANQHWAKLIKPLNIMRRKVMDLTGRTFGEQGAAAVERQANYTAIKSLLERDNLTNVADFRAWNEALEGIDGIAKAYEDHGIIVPKNINAIRDAIANIGQNANRAQLYSVMAKRAENLKKDPSLWNALSGALGKIPVVGKGAEAVDVAGNLRDYLTRKGGRKALQADEKKLFDILDRALLDGAKNPNLQNAAVSSEFSPTIASWLKEHAKDLGVKIPMGVGAVGAGGLFATEAEAAQPPDATTPEGAYSRALKDITEAGEKTTPKRTKEYLEGKSPKSKGPLSVFSTKKGQSLQESLHDRREAIEALADPEALLSRASGSMGQLSRTHPGVYQAVVTKLVKITGYLKRELPPIVGKTPLNPKGYRPTLDQSMTYAAKFVGATSPDQTLTDIARGQALPQQVASLKENWPEVYDQFRTDLMGKLTAMGDEGKALPPLERMRQLDTLLDLDGAANPAMSWKVADSIEAARAAEDQAKAQPPAGPAKGGAPSLAGNFATGQQAMAQLRLNA